MNDLKSTENMSFEEALQELEQIVRRLDTGQENLETAIIAFERAAALKKHCEEKLNQAKLKIEKITKTSDGTIVTQEVTADKL